MGAYRCKQMDGALEAIEGVLLSVPLDLEGLVLIVPAV